MMRQFRFAKNTAIGQDRRAVAAHGFGGTSLARAGQFRRNSRTGRVMVNLAAAGTDYHAPFGSRGGSRFGPGERGQYAAEFHTMVKTVYVNAGHVSSGSPR